MSLSWLDAQLGRLFSRGVEQELPGGINFVSPLSATPNLETGYLDVGSDTDAIVEDVLDALTPSVADGGALPDDDAAIDSASGAVFTLTDPTDDWAFTPDLLGPIGLTIFIEVVSNANSKTCLLVNSGTGGGDFDLGDDQVGYGVIFQFDGYDWAQTGVYLRRADP